MYKQLSSKNIREINLSDFEDSVHATLDYLDFKMMFLKVNVHVSKSQPNEALCLLKEIEALLPNICLRDNEIEEVHLLFFTLISNIYSLKKQHNKVIEYSSKGLVYSVENSNYDYYHLLLFKKAISEYSLKEDSFRESIIKFIPYTILTCKYEFLYMALYELKNNYVKIYDYIHSISSIKNLLNHQIDYNMIRMDEKVNPYELF